MMQVSSHLIQTLKSRESLRLTAYTDSAGVWTIGWGATSYESGAKVVKGDVITLARAEQLLGYHVGIAAAAVNSQVTATLTQGQFDALVSFVYNVGSANFAKSTLRVLVNTNPNDFSRINAEFLKWVFVTVGTGKIKIQGLVNRRNEEIEIYASGDGNVKKKAELITLALGLLALVMVYRVVRIIKL
jgi:lysozyme